MNDNDLKPCPFCGGKGLLWPSYPSGWQVGCANDDCEVQCWVSSRKDEAAAAAVWNQRPALAPPEGWVLMPVDVQKDAERYRWLRDHAPEEWDVTRWLDNETQEIHVQDYLDEAIDEAMLAARPEEL